MILFRLYSFLTCRPLWTSLGDCHLFFQLCRCSLSQGHWPTLSKPQVLLGRIIVDFMGELFLSCSFVLGVRAVVLVVICTKQGPSFPACSRALSGSRRCFARDRRIVGQKVAEF